MPDPIITGVYQWRNLVNGKVYVGGAYQSFERRRADHLRALRAGSHFNRALQRSWRKRGRAAFAFEVLERCPPERVQEREQAWINRLRATDPAVGYNVCPVAGSRLGSRWTEEARAKASARRQGVGRGRKDSAEVRARKSAAASKRMAADPAAREGIGAVNRGKPLAAAARAKLSKKAGDRWRAGRYQSRRHGMTKWSDGDVRAMRSRFQDGATLTEVCDEFGVSKSHACAIRLGRYRAGVASE